MAVGPLFGRIVPWGVDVPDDAVPHQTVAGNSENPGPAGQSCLGDTA